MKALKEKRISLRSLWRRGLVILSLFALVFASCSDSSSGSGGSAADVGGKRVVYFNVVQNPTEDQFYGQPLDLTGLVLDVFYSDGSRDQAATDTNNVTVFPRVATGVYEADNTKVEGYKFDPLEVYEVYYKGVHGQNNISIKGKMWWIYRTNTSTTVSEYPGDVPVVGSMDLGIHLTGAANIKQEAFADDDTYNLNGLTLEADYVKNYTDRPGGNIVAGTNPQIVRKPIKLQDVSWEIKPRYDDKAYEARGGDNGGGYYDGYLYLTVGRFIDYQTLWNTNRIKGWQQDLPYTSAAWNGTGITVMVPLAKVWTVKKNGIELIYDPDAVVKSAPTDYYYWEENTRESWIKRLGDKAQLKITYTNGDVQTKDVKDLADASRIYWNSNTQQGADPGWTEEGYYLGPLDFDIMSLKYPFSKKSTALGVRIYYRGAIYPIDVNVFTVLQKVDATPAIQFWPDPKWDNDVDNGKGGAAELAKRLEVKAIYKAVNNDETREVPLTYYYATDAWWKNVADATYLGKPWTEVGYDAISDVVAGRQLYGPFYRTGPYYIFASSEDYDDDTEVEAGEVASAEAAESTYAKGYLKYKNNQLKGKETTTNVVVRHDMWVDDTDAGDNWRATLVWWYETLFKTRYNEFLTANGKYPAGGTIGGVNYGPWVDHDGANGAYRGMLPNGWSPYDPEMKKEPWGFINANGEKVNQSDKPNWPNPARDFGPKLKQGKKFKVAVTWVNEYK